MIFQNTYYNKKIFFIIFTLFLISCGQRSNLIITPLPIPPPPSEIRLSQRGNNLNIHLQYPKKFKNGNIFNKLDKIEIIGYYQIGNTAEHKSLKTLYSEENVNFDKNNGVDLKLKLPDKTGEIFFYIISKNKKFSCKTKQQKFNFIENFPSPIIKIYETKQEGIKLVWETKFSFPFIAIYKNDFKKPYKIIEGLEDSFIDTNFEPNKKIKYAITGIIKESPRIETTLSKIIEIEPKDIFPPPKVENIKYLFLKNNKILIRWDKLVSKDLKGYNLYYSFNGIKYKKYNKEPVTENTILIQSPPRKKSLLIYICSIDNSGNESEESEIIKIK